MKKNISIKRTILFLMTAAIIVFMLVVGIMSYGYAAYITGSSSYSDVKNSWYSEAVNVVANHNIMNGTSDNKFEPNVKMTRAMAAQILYKMGNINCDTTKYNTSHFKDVSNNDWYANAVEWCYKNRIATGTDATHFSPNNIITREQMVVMVFNLLGGTNEDHSWDYLVPYNDKNLVHDWAKDAMSWAIGKKIITGTHSDCLDVNLVNPRGKLSRAEAATIVASVFDKYNLHNYIYTETVIINGSVYDEYICEICKHIILERK